MLETAFVFDNQGRVLLWHEPKGRSSVSLPDSPKLWDFLWENRANLGGVAHTHPWKGSAEPSQEDITTFSAIEAGLGQRLCWPIVTLDQVAYIQRHGIVKGAWMSGQGPPFSKAPWFLDALEELRKRST